ncbi:MAG TPA: hypothetical protein VMR81_03720 [Patescibacteria group bacterium]|jgi:hypothetical protein|nr:hypothetical protein [Patescibacteria group bacterium]
MLNLEAYIRAYICFGLTINGNMRKPDETVGKHKRFIKGDGVIHVLSPNRTEAYKQCVSLQEDL